MHAPGVGVGGVEDDDGAAERFEAEMVPREQEIAGALAEFVGCLRTGRTPETEAAANIRSLAMVEAAVASAESGERVCIDDVLAASLHEALAAEDRPEVRAHLEQLMSGVPVA